MRLLTRFFMMALMMGACSAWAGDFRVGVVDIERVLRESAPAMKAEKRIEKEFSVRDQEIKKLMKQVKDLQTMLEKDAGALSDADHRNKERELSAMNANLQRLQREFREDLNLRKNEELAAVLELANKAVQAIAESERYDLILQEAVYRNPKIDITDKVIKHLSVEKPAAKEGK